LLIMDACLTCADPNANTRFGWSRLAAAAAMAVQEKQRKEKKGKI